MTSREYDSEDLLQDTLLRVYQGLDQFDGKHPRAWLWTILRNVELNRTRRQRPGSLNDRQHPEPVARITATASPEASAEGHFIYNAVDAALSKLPKGLVQVAVLIYLDELSHSDPAVALNIPVGTVRSRIHRASKRFRGTPAGTGLPQNGEPR